MAPHNFAFFERETGIEPAFIAWEAIVLPLYYSRKIARDCDLYLKILEESEFLEKSGREEGRVPPLNYARRLIDIIADMLKFVDYD